MPKRPCAIALTADDSTVICADKFGDVYSIPLLFSDSSASSEGQEESSKATKLLTKSSKPFVPAANDLTIHSVRNRRALQNQMKQKQNISEKSEPQFERKLLLGHASMLTDIALIERNGQNYIITADRDEHIRISRGIPQAHIIEGYCLGHKNFVSRLCLPAGQPNLLISGGGDDDIYVWDWSLGKLLDKINLRSHAGKVVFELDPVTHTNGEGERSDTPPSEPVKVAVSSIQCMRGASDQEDDLILVTCEGLVSSFFTISGSVC
jgi:tRNA (guanine-N(7)-)-methyltransferase subunit TRM82